MNRFVNFVYDALTSNGFGAQKKDEKKIHLRENVI